MTHSFVFYYTLIVLYVSSFIIQDYIDLGYEFKGGGYGTYIVAENGLKLSLNDHAQYSEESDAENEFFDFIDMFKKS